MASMRCLLALFLAWPLFLILILVLIFLVLLCFLPRPLCSYLVEEVARDLDALDCFELHVLHVDAVIADGRALLVIEEWRELEFVEVDGLGVHAALAPALVVVLAFGLTRRLAKRAYEAARLHGVFGVSIAPVLTFL
jgi:hypothetical protein